MTSQGEGGGEGRALMMIDDEGRGGSKWPFL